MRYKNYILKPGDFVQYGGDVNHGFTRDDIPESVKDYNRSTYLRNVYATKRKRVKQKMLSENQVIQKVIGFLL